MSSLLLGVITLITALVISSVAAYVSVTGMVIIFAATPITCYIMFGALETGKLVAAQWLHVNWRNKEVTTYHKAYMLVAVAVLMVITAFGIYGFLSKGHLDQEAPIEGLTLQIAQKEQSVKMLEATNTRLQTKLDQLDAGVSSFIKGDKAERANSVRGKQKSERLDIEKQIAENNNKINAINDAMLVTKLESSKVEAKLGPIKYVAELFGWKDTGAAVRMLILMVMVAFDPLAIVLMLSGWLTIAKHWESRTTKEAARTPPSVNHSYPQNEQVVETVAAEPVAQLTENADTENPDNIDSNDSAVELELAPMEEKVESPVTEPPVKRKSANKRKPRKLPPELDAKVVYDSALKTVARAYKGEPPSLTFANKPVESTDAAQLIEILENNPSLLANVIDVVKDNEAASSNTEPLKQETLPVMPSSWLSIPSK